MQLGLSSRLQEGLRAAPVALIKKLKKRSEFSRNPAIAQVLKDLGINYKAENQKLTADVLQIKNCPRGQFYRSTAHTTKVISARVSSSSSSSRTPAEKTCTPSGIRALFRFPAPARAPFETAQSPVQNFSHSNNTRLDHTKSNSHPTPD